MIKRILSYTGARPTTKEVIGVCISVIVAVTALLFILINSGCYHNEFYEPKPVIIDNSPKPIGSPERIRGVSMEPTLFHKSWYYVVKTPYEKLAVGDIVKYVDMGGNLIVHRIVSKNGEYFKMKGDNNKYPDGTYLSRHNYVGEVFPVEINPNNLVRL